MALTTNEEIRRVFELASLRREAASVRTPRQWARVNRLMERCREAHAQEIKNFNTHYNARVDQRRLALIDQAAAKHSILKPFWVSHDRFSPSATRIMAERQVREAHAQRIERISEYERRQLKAMLREFRSLNPIRGDARKEFERVNGRRIIDFNEWKRPLRDR